MARLYRVELDLEFMITTVIFRYLCHVGHAIKPAQGIQNTKLLLIFHSGWFHVLATSFEYDYDEEEENTLHCHVSTSYSPKPVENAVASFPSHRHVDGRADSTTTEDKDASRVEMIATDY